MYSIRLAALDQILECRTCSMLVASGLRANGAAKRIQSTEIGLSKLNP